MAQCRAIGFSGPVWPVHPDRGEVGGARAYPSVAALPGVPDAVFIGVNRNATLQVVADLAALGAGGAVCFAAGFAEAAAELSDGQSAQAALVAAAGEMPFLGPNCYGFINYLEGAALWPDQQGGRRVDRGVALVTQSSNIALNLTMQTRGLPIACIVTVGNQAQTGCAEIGQALLEDPRITALGLHLEGIGDLRAFEALAATARRLGKPIVALKVGASEQARVATVSHTASLSGSDAGAAAVLARLGIARVHSLSGLLEALKLLHVTGPLGRHRIASLSCSGGEASLMADRGQARGLHFPPLQEAQRVGLRAALGPQVALANPLDYNTYIWGDLAAMAGAFTAMMTGGDLAMGIVVLDFPRPDRCTAPAWDDVLVAVASAQARSGVPMAVLASLPETMPEAVAERLVAEGIVPLCGMEAGLEAVAAAVALGRKSGPAAPLMVPRPVGDAVVVSEAEGKAELAAFGLVVPQGRRATTAAQAARSAEALGFPLVLKGEGVAHKTEGGAVVLNLMQADAVEAAARAMACDGFLVEHMVLGGVAELLVGVICDPAHGYVLTLAAGGVLAEVLQDRVSLLVPSSREAVADALHSLRIARLLAGWRGGPIADMEAIVSAVMGVQAYVQAKAPQEVEINPLICTPTGAIAADVLIKRTPT